MPTHLGFQMINKKNRYLYSYLMNICPHLKQTQPEKYGEFRTLIANGISVSIAPFGLVPFLHIDKDVFCAETNKYYNKYKKNTDVDRCRNLALGLGAEFLRFAAKGLLNLPSKGDINVVLFDNTQNSEYQVRINHKQKMAELHCQVIYICGRKDLLARRFMRPDLNALYNII